METLRLPAAALAVALAFAAEAVSAEVEHSALGRSVGRTVC